jgi:hypothetical protein
MSEDFVFDLTCIQTPVVIGGIQHVLREASEAVAAEYQNIQIHGASLEGDKVTRMPTNPADMVATLVGGCLYRCKDGITATEDTADRDIFPEPVGKDHVRKWPHRIVDPLFDEAKRISNLGPADLATLKKQAAALAEQIAKREKVEEQDPTKS